MWNASNLELLLQRKPFYMCTFVSTCVVGLLPFLGFVFLLNLFFGLFVVVVSLFSGCEGVKGRGSS